MRVTRHGLAYLVCAVGGVHYTIQLTMHELDTKPCVVEDDETQGYYGMDETDDIHEAMYTSKMDDEDGRIVEETLFPIDDDYIYHRKIFTDHGETSFSHGQCTGLLGMTSGPCVSPGRTTGTTQGVYRTRGDHGEHTGASYGVLTIWTRD